MRRETAFQKGSVLTLHDLGHVCQMHVIMIASLIAGIILLSNRIRNDPQQIYCYSADALFFVLSSFFSQFISFQRAILFHRQKSIVG